MRLYSYTGCTNNSYLTRQHKSCPVRILYFILLFDSLPVWIHFVHRKSSRSFLFLSCICLTTKVKQSSLKSTDLRCPVKLDIFEILERGNEEISISNITFTIISVRITNLLLVSTLNYKSYERLRFEQSRSRSNDQYLRFSILHRKFLGVPSSGRAIYIQEYYTDTRYTVQSVRNGWVNSAREGEVRREKEADSLKGRARFVRGTKRNGARDRDTRQA